MNREEQIQRASQDFTSKYISNSASAFRAGARWADAHPKEDGVEMWIARNKKGDQLSLHNSQPIYDNDNDRWVTIIALWDTTYIFLPNDFPEVTFENSPQKVILTLVKE